MDERKCAVSDLALSASRLDEERFFDSSLGVNDLVFVSYQRVAVSQVL